jgi:hypothetical protein
MSTTIYHKRCSHSTGHTKIEKVQRFACTGSVDLFITYVECFVLVSSVNFVYVGKFLRKYGSTHVEITNVESRLFYSERKIGESEREGCIMKDELE